MLTVTLLALVNIIALGHIVVLILPPLCVLSVTDLGFVGGGGGACVPLSLVKFRSLLFLFYM